MKKSFNILVTLFSLLFILQDALCASAVVTPAVGEVLDRHIYPSSRNAMGQEYTPSPDLLIYNPHKVDELKHRYRLPPLVSTEHVPLMDPCADGRYKTLRMGQQKTLTQSKKILYTNGIADCIGIAVWDQKTKIACLYHCSKMELRDKADLMFKKEFIDHIKREIPDLSEVKVYLASTYWSEDAMTVIKMLEENGFHITGISIPDMAIISPTNDSGLTQYVSKPLDVLGVNPLKKPVVTSMVLNADTGAVGVLRTYFGTEVHSYSGHEVVVSVPKAISL